ncbi:hypothetical protein B0T24DRAFT_680449 [Lasiosphaeria ovina]|uniref:Uncharacterized protein n=1 Tax=Lasiosphaeria ovina TaxID=92902 RepID=A0AAE0K885_9PEZI|nr:hypothetical protein B0T24DRAFT_680449 [Lasiosphaeria ovina]
MTFDQAEVILSTSAAGASSSAASTSTAKPPHTTIRLSTPSLRGESKFYTMHYVQSNSVATEVLRNPENETALQARRAKGKLDRKAKKARKAAKKEADRVAELAAVEAAKKKRGGK